MRDMLVGVLGVFAVFGYMSEARNFQTGHLVVAVTAKDSTPVTNATVFVKTLNRTGLSAGKYDRDYTTTTARSDTNGVVDVAFQFLTSCFDWWVETPAHHSASFHCRNAHFNSSIVPSDYENINTNTVKGLAMYNELKALNDIGDHVGYLAKFEPMSVVYTNAVMYQSAETAKVIRRSNGHGSDTCGDKREGKCRFRKLCQVYRAFSHYEEHDLRRVSLQSHS